MTDPMNEFDRRDMAEERSEASRLRLEDAAASKAEELRMEAIRCIEEMPDAVLVDWMSKNGAELDALAADGAAIPF